VPIETVSESEDGFERVYQGSQIMPIWTAHIEPGATWTAEAVLRIGPARRSTPVASGKSSLLES